MKVSKKLLNTMKRWARKVMNCGTFLDYIEIICTNYDLYSQSRIETVSFGKESADAKSVYSLLSATLCAMEYLLTEHKNTIVGIATKQSFQSAVNTLGAYLNLPEIIHFINQKPKEFFETRAKNQEFLFSNESKATTGEEFFKSKPYKFAMLLLKKIAYETAKEIYEYIEDYTTDSDEMISWIDECKMYITDWKRLLIEPDEWFDTDDLSDTDVLLGSSKIFMTAKIISLLED